MTEREELWNRCDVCGRFIALADFNRGAVRTMFLPDTDTEDARETWETLCRLHAVKP